MRKEGTIPSNVVHKISVLKLPQESAVLGTLLAGESRTGEMTKRTTVFVSDRSTGIFEVAKTPFRLGCISTANRWYCNGPVVSIGRTRPSIIAPR